MNIFIDEEVKNTSACVEAPTQIPIIIVHISISAVDAVFANLVVTPLSLRRLPKKSIPRRGIAAGTIIAVITKPAIGNIIFSVF